MKILFLSDNFPPEINAPALRSYEHCKEWVGMGAEVTVITCTPNFPQGKVYKGYRNKLYQKEYIEGIKVLRVWSYITSNQGLMKRVIDYISFAFSSFWAGLFIKCDIIIATSPQFFTTWSAYFLSLLKRRPWIFELRDLWPESIAAVGAVSSKNILKLLGKIELFLYKKSSCIISLTKSFKKNLVARGIKKNKIKIIYNGVNLNRSKIQGKNKKILNKLNLNNKFVVAYIGTHGMAHGLDFILRAIKNITDSNLIFLFIGDGAMKEKLLSLNKKLKLNNTIFLNPVSTDIVPQYLSITDIALVPLKKEDTFKTVIPSKIFEAVAMSKPILLGVEGEAKQLIKKYNAGLCYDPGNVKDFLQKLLLLYSDKNIYNKCINGCKKLALDFNRKELAKKMFLVLEKVIAGKF